MDKQTKYTTKCMLTAPLMNGKEPIGVIMALNKQGADSFSKSDQEVSGEDSQNHRKLRNWEEMPLALVFDDTNPV